MPRKTNKHNEHEFTRQIHSTVRRGTSLAAMPNWNEKLAKAEKKVCCHDCRYYELSCRGFIGRYHQTCDEFEWW